MTPPRLTLCSVLIVLSPCVGQTWSPPPPLPDNPSPASKRKHAQAEAAFATLRAAPRDEQRIIWYGRRLAYLAHYDAALAVYAEGLKLHPNSPKLLRHRGHRFISLRRFADAVADLSRAARLIDGRADEIEPDGQPNARNIPTSSLHTNTWYHLGLARYCRGEFAKALACYERCLAAAKNRDMEVATRYWLFLTARRLRDKSRMKLALAPVRADWDVIENTAYHRLLLLYRRDLLLADLAAKDEDAIQDKTVGYGLARASFVRGDTEAGEAALRVLVAERSPAFGCIAAEADLARAAKLIAEAKAIHARVLSLDTHKDIQSSLALDPSSEDPAERKRWRERNDPTVRGTNQVDFPKMREGGYDCAFYIVYVGQGRLAGGGYVNAKRQALLKFNAIHRMAKKYPKHITIAYTPDDVRRIHAAGRLVACIGIENGYPMGTDLSLIEEFHRRGARYMSICHNRHSQLGDSHTPKEPLHGGLSELGRKAIAEMNRVGMMVDISHSGKTTMLQALAASKAPVIASHSGCAGVRAHGRNLDDEQLLALEKNGGVIQCVALGSFVKDTRERDEAVAALRQEIGVPSRREMWRMRRDNKPMPEDLGVKLATLRKRTKRLNAKFPRANVEDFVDHIDHAVALIGIEHVAISSDFDGGGGVVGWNNASETFNVTLELARRGYSEQQIARLWSGNTLRLWAEVARVAARIRGR